MDKKHNFIMLALVAAISVLISGCTEEKKILSIPESSNGTANISSMNITIQPKEKNIPEIKITSFSSIYIRDNEKIEEYKHKYNISERHYAVYELSIKNNGSSSLTFKSNELHLRAGDQVFETTTLESPGNNQLDVLSDLAKGNKIEDKILPPGQNIHGYVAFAVNSLYDKSFHLMYNATPIASASLEKGIDALTAAELFNYSVAFGKPPYSYCRGTDLYAPKFDEPVGIYCDTWANWVNRSVFEVFQKDDLERMQRSKPDDIPLTKIVYALKVVPERNITMFPVKTKFDSYNFLVVDTAGEEIINKSIINQGGVAVLNDRTYRVQPSWALDIPQMNLSDATIVQVSFEGTYGWSMAMRLNFNNQDIILDKVLNVVVARYSYSHFIT